MPFTVKTPRIFVLYAERVRLKLSVSWAPANDESGPDSNRDAPKAPPASRPTPMSRSVGAMIMPRADAKSRAVGMLRTPGSTAIRSRGVGMLRTLGNLRYELADYTGWQFREALQWGFKLDGRLRRGELCAIHAVISGAG
jgi:hypothetical protein